MRPDTREGGLLAVLLVLVHNAEVVGKVPAVVDGRARGRLGDGVVHQHAREARGQTLAEALRVLDAARVAVLLLVLIPELGSSDDAVGHRLRRDLDP